MDGVKHAGKLLQECLFERHEPQGAVALPRRLEEERPGDKRFGGNTFHSKAHRTL